MDFTAQIEQCRIAVEKCRFRDAAIEIGMSADEGRQIYRWVGGYSRPRADRVIALAKHLKVSPQALGALFMVAWIDRSIDRALPPQDQAPVAVESSPPEVRSNCLRL
jgi:hypothetical protein